MERRISKELEKVRQKFDAECVNDSLVKWHVAINGPDDSPYFGGTFLVELTFKADYPFTAPDLTFQTKIYHPNINHRGEICLALLKNEWSPSKTPLMILENLVQLLKRPDSDDPLVPEIASIFNRDLNAFKAKAEEWTHKYAV